MSLGVGILIGQSYSASQERSDQHAEELAAMRKELAEKLGAVCFQEAFKVAAAEVHAEIIDELAKAAVGKLPARRLSDPKNVDARNDAFVNHAAAAVKRISGGKLSMTEDKIRKVRANRPLK